MLGRFFAAEDLLSDDDGSLPHDILFAENINIAAFLARLQRVFGDHRLLFRRADRDADAGEEAGVEQAFVAGRQLRIRDSAPDADSTGRDIDAIFAEVDFADMRVALTQLLLMLDRFAPVNAPSAESTVVAR